MREHRQEWRWVSDRERGGRTQGKDLWTSFFLAAITFTGAGKCAPVLTHTIACASAHGALRRGPLLAASSCSAGPSGPGPSSSPHVCTVCERSLLCCLSALTVVLSVSAHCCAVCQHSLLCCLSCRVRLKAHTVTSLPPPRTSQCVSWRREASKQD
eukprot:38564-Rhodomonas_salina.1